MKRNHEETPLYTKLNEFASSVPISFHVPGHKNGSIFPERAKGRFQSILSIDATELTGLDDLHAPEAVITQAEALAADYFGSAHTFFLVGGSTAGNLAMILSVCSTGEKMIVQRNCHKSVMNGLELAGARPIFVAPQYDEAVDRYTSPCMQSMKQAIDENPEAKGVVLTYPDYFGRTFDIKTIIDYAHDRGIPVLVDEAHGVHFSLGQPFPKSALHLGADVVVQSAHKMAPSMTMSSFLHMDSTIVSKRNVGHFLQVLQSSSPSYPLMASLDLARSFLATQNNKSITRVLESVQQVRSIFTESSLWDVLPVSDLDDPLKITLQVKEGLSAFEVAHAFEGQKIYPELATHNQLLLIHGLGIFTDINRLRNSVKRISEQLKIVDKHATIEISNLFSQPVEQLALDYVEMRNRLSEKVPLEAAEGLIAAESIVPYPPGIPLILRGEQITEQHITFAKQLMRQGARMQMTDINKGIFVFKGEELS